MKFKPSRLVVAVVLTAVTAAGQATFGTLAAQGDLAFSHGKFADAEKSYVEALKQPRETPEATSREAAILNSLAIIYSLEGRYAESESLCLRAVTMVETTSGKADPVLASILSALGSVNLHLGKYSKAGQYIQRAIALRKGDASTSRRTYCPVKQRKNRGTVLQYLQLRDIARDGNRRISGTFSNQSTPPPNS
jgi:Flp pilus assembly protein TadD